MRNGGDLTETELVDRLRLARSEHVGPVTFRQLLARFGTASAALDALPDLARRGGARRLKIAGRDDAEREIEALSAMGGEVVPAGDDRYPPLLAAIEDAPPILTVLGHPSLLRRRSIAVVGGRNSSVAGRSIAATLASELGAADLAVVSGLARGVDAAAHEAAMETGTIAVLAGGVDVVFPPENRALYDAMRERGLIVSEMPLGTQPLGRNFPRRNRIISGLSLGVVVIEARRRSGTLITARRAADQGRDVFVVPGSPLDPRSHGGNDLIRDGAMLVQEADDILRELAGPGALLEKRETAWPAAGFDASDDTVERARRQVLEGLSPTPVSIDALVRALGLPPAVVQCVLLELELAGRLQRHPGGGVSLR